MAEKPLNLIKYNIFNATALCILGAVFLFKPTTLFVTVLLLFGLLQLVVSNEFRVGFRAALFEGEYRWIARAFFFWLIVNLLLSLIHATGGGVHFPDNALRIWMATILFACATGVSSKIFFLTGLGVSGAACLFWGVYQWPFNGWERAVATTNNAIHFGNISALVMLMSLTIALLVKSNVRWIFFLSALGGGVGALASMTRSSFFILILLFPMAFILPGVNKIRAVFNLVASIVMVVIFFFVAPSGIVEKFRIGQAVQDLHLMANSQYNTSLGIRLVLWKSALLDFNESPILGVGEGVFQKNFEQRVNKGEIPAVSAFNQPHSDIFHALSSGGILKLIGYLGIIFAPFIFFLTKSRGLNIKPDHRLMSILGLEVVGSYFITGLTNSNFDLQIYSTTYAVLVCVLAKLSSLDDSAAINAAEPSKPSTPATPSC